MEKTSKDNSTESKLFAILPIFSKTNKQKVEKK